MVRCQFPGPRGHIAAMVRRWGRWGRWEPPLGPLEPLEPAGPGSDGRRRWWGRGRRGGGRWVGGAGGVGSRWGRRGGGGDATTTGGAAAVSMTAADPTTASTPPTSTTSSSAARISTNVPATGGGSRCPPCRWRFRATVRRRPRRPHRLQPAGDGTFGDTRRVRAAGSRFRTRLRDRRRWRRSRSSGLWAERGAT